MAADPTVQTLGGNPKLELARRRFNRCSEWESNARQRFIEDLKFRHGDSDNGYQWPSDIRQNRTNNSKPCLTMNLIRSHNLMISNEARKNKSSVKFVGTGNGATQESANIYKDLMRRIEFQSHAQDSYTIARGFQVDGGIGYWRIVTRYVDDDSFDQDIFIDPVPDPLCIYLDPDCKQLNKSDGKFAFAFDLVPKEDWEEAYPKFKDMIGTVPMGVDMSGSDVTRSAFVQVCEYFEVVTKPDKLVSFISGTGERKNIRRSLMPEGTESVLKDKLTKSRDIEVKTVEWKLIVGDKIVDETDWLGTFIPIVPCIGEEYVIEGQMDRKGHTRAMKDAQRMYNYSSSSQIEHVALQGKTPWKAPAAAIEGFESMWNTANNVNHSVLIYKHVDDEGNIIPPPERQEPPVPSPAYQAGMETAFNQMMMTSGQWQNQLGMGGNERTGDAIGKRQAQSDTATFNYQDNYEGSLLYTGKQIAELIPLVYDTARTMQIIAEDGTDYSLEIDPAAAKHYAAELDHTGQVVKKIFNPKMGRYDVAPSVGPEYGTKRQDTVDALTLILTQAPALTGIIGDLLLGSMEFEKAQEAAQRLRRMVPPQALGDGPSQQEQQLQQQVQSLGQALEKSLQEAGKDKVRLLGKQELRDIEVYDAETKRIAALAKTLPTEPEALHALIQQMVQDALGTTLKPILMANAAQLSPDGANQAESQAEDIPTPPDELGAQKAPDGAWYVLDPTRHGKYLKLSGLAQNRSPGGRT